MVYIVLKRGALYATTDEYWGSIPHLVTNKIQQQLDNIINNNMLIDQIKPEILVKLDKDYEKYNTSINHIYNVLATKQVYAQLTIDEIKDIFTFASLDYMEWSPSDLLFGDRMLKQDYNYKYGK